MFEPAFSDLLMTGAVRPDCEAAHQGRMNDMAAAPPAGHEAYGEPPAILATRWGAVATGDGAMGVAEMMTSREEAGRKAMRDCRDSAPGATCTVRMADYNPCVAVSLGRRGIHDVERSRPPRGRSRIFRQLQRVDDGLRASLFRLQLRRTDRSGFR